MARRSTEAVSDEVSAETVAEIDSTEGSEVVAVDGEVTEAVVDGESAETDAADEADEVVDLTGLWGAVNAILDGDISNPSEIDYASVTTAYTALSRKGKSTATRELSNRSQELLEEGEFDKARVILLAGKATKVKAKGTGAVRAPRTPTDPTAALVEKLAAFQLAYAVTIDTLPDGLNVDEVQAKVTAEVSPEARAQIGALAEWYATDAETRGEAPNVSGAVAMAGKFAFRQTRKPYGARHNVGEHIAQVFARAEVGTELSDAQIAAEKSEEYGDDECSTSAVNARLNSGKPLPEGLELITGENDKVTGVRKVA